MNAATRVLELLEQFRFLTRPQMCEAGLTLNADHLGEVLRKLEKRDFIGHISLGVAPGTGRLHFIYYLTKRGAVFLAEANRVDIESLSWCEGKPSIGDDYTHRLMCVSVHVWLSRVLGQSLTEFRPYYRKAKEGGKYRHSSRFIVAGTAVVPDALFTVEHDGGRFGYVLEVQNEKKRNAMVDQLTNHAMAVNDGVAADALGVDDVAVMYVVNNARDLERLRNAAGTLAPLRGRLFGQSLESLKAEPRFSSGSWEPLA